jgi:hypothetical protein
MRQSRVSFALTSVLIASLTTACLVETEESTTDQGEGTDTSEEAIYSSDPSILAAWPGSTIREALSRQKVMLGGGAKVNAPGLFAGAFQLTTQGDYVEVADKTPFNVGSGDFSVSLWLKTPDPSFRTIIDNRVEDPEIRGYSLWLSEGNLGIQISNGDYENFITSAFISDDQWHHIAVSVARADPEGLKVYVDGFPVAMFDPTARQGSLDNAKPLRFGAWSDFASFDKTLIGSLDEIKIWKKALSPHEAMTEAAKLKMVTPSSTRTLYEEPYDRCSVVLAADVLASYQASPSTGRAGLLRDWLCSDPARTTHLAVAKEVIKAYGLNESVGTFQARRCTASREYRSSAVTSGFLGANAVPSADAISDWRACMLERTDGFYCEPKRQGKVASAKVHWDTTFGPGNLFLTVPTFKDIFLHFAVPPVMNEGFVGVGFDLKSNNALLGFSATRDIVDPFASSFDTSCAMAFEETPTHYDPCAKDRFHIRLDRVRIEKGGDAAGDGDNQWSICFYQGTTADCRVSPQVKGPTGSGKGVIDVQLGEGYAMDYNVSRSSAFAVDVTVWDNDRGVYGNERAEFIQAQARHSWTSNQWTASVTPTIGGNIAQNGYLEGSYNARFRAKAWWSVQRTEACTP